VRALIFAAVCCRVLGTPSDLPPSICSHLHPAAWLHRLPESITWEEGALLEPLAVSLAGIERSGLQLGDPVVICGAGASAGARFR